MTKITRRSALITGVSVLGASACSPSPKEWAYPVSFNHGVASGDPTAKSVILWTRITPSQDGALTGIWQISKTKDFAKIARRGKFATDKAQDYTVKIDAAGLKPGQTYYYRFQIGKTQSPFGRTKTLPAGGVEDARFAVVSCSNYPFGFFNVYDHIAKDDGFDAVIHLGDYIYEYGADGYGGKVGAKLGRPHAPANEIISLSDYRTRHAQYKADPASRAMHAAHPLIAIWDDHETANDSWKTGAQNHGPNEGSWDERRAAAMQAYYEWMPVRDPVAGKPREALFRTYSYGDLLTITSIETRLTARTRQIAFEQYKQDFQTAQGRANFQKNILGDPEREMLGGAQRDYIAESLKSSKAKQQPWRLIANQIIMARSLTPDISDYEGQDFIYEIEKVFPAIHDFIALSPLGLPTGFDKWDGYPAARTRFYDMAAALGVKDLLVLTGDSHVSWANQLTHDDGSSMGVELGVTGTTSPGFDAYFKEATEDYSARLRAKNPDIKWNQSAERGFIDLRLGRTQGRADYISVSTVYSPEYTVFAAKSFNIVRSGDSLKLEEA